VVLGADQDLKSIAIATSQAGLQSLDLGTPSNPDAFRSVRIHNSSAAAAKISLYALIQRSQINPGDGIYDSGLSFHHDAALGLAQLFDAHGDAMILIRPTRIGDLNLDGQVTISDFIDLASNFGHTDATWQEGDLNYDGQVTIS